LDALDPDPIVQFGAWFEAARAAGGPLPEAMTLATATPDGRPSARMVLLKGWDSSGFVFFSNYESRKGSELALNGRAALVFHWPLLQRQVRVAGTVSRTSRADSVAYFRTRPKGSQVAVLVSRQSTVVPDREALDQPFRRLLEEYRDRPVPMPPYWGGYRVRPEEIEFWQHRENRLHDRFRYLRVRGGWRCERLAP
jgi:pyridoxamine 5'-phosphate oxidase